MNFLKSEYKRTMIVEHTWLLGCNLLDNLGNLNDLE